MDEYRDLDRYQDDLGQLPMLQAYSHILYFFPAPPTTPREQIIYDVEAAVTKVRQAVPWMGARVICIGRGAGSSGVYRAVACTPPVPAIDVKDVPDALPDYSVVRSRRAPLSVIDTKQLTPVPGYPEKFDVDSDESPAHVVRVQLNFTQGGVVMDFAIAHNMADAGGHFGLVKMVAMAMRGEEFPAPLLAAANYDRRRAVPLLQPNEPSLDHNHHRRSPTTIQGVRASPASYHVFRCTVASMAALKDHAGSGLDQDVPFISTDDAICAFAWQRLITARKNHFPPETKSRFGRQIDGRRLVGLPAAYMGDVIHTVSTWLTFEELTSKPLSYIASHLRRRLNETNTLQHLRSFATFIAREPDKAIITYAGQFEPSVDVGCSSIRGLQGVFPEFGYLGKPEFIRRPPSAPFPSTVVLFPGTVEGDCDAVLGLTDAEFEILTRDAEWSKYTEHIG
jgi:hypothetical protein